MISLKVKKIARILYDLASLDISNKSQMNLARMNYYLYLIQVYYLLDREKPAFQDDFYVSFEKNKPCFQIEYYEYLHKELIENQISLRDAYKIDEYLIETIQMIYIKTKHLSTRAFFNMFTSYSLWIHNNDGNMLTKEEIRAFHTKKNEEGDCYFS